MKLPALALCLILSPAASAQDFSGTEKGAAPDSAARVAANEALAARDYPKAVKLLQPLADATPTDAHVLYDLGSAQDALDQTSAAEKSYRAAISDDIAYIDPRVALGLLLARSGRLEDAHAELVAAVSIDKADKLLRARALRALARIDQKDHPGEARDELLAALSLSPETRADTLMSAELAESATGGKDAAKAAYRRVLTENPNDPEATAALAHLLSAEKKFPEAEKLLESGLAAHPGDPAMTVQLAAVYTSGEDPAKAIPLVASLQKANPQDPTLNHMLAVLYFQAKDYANAEPLFAKLSAQTPQDGNLVDLRAESLMYLHKTAEAQRILTPVVANPALFASQENWGLASYHLAFSASENNEPAVVLQVLQNRAKVLPPTPPILFLTAISEDKLHHVKNAIKAYKDFVAASNGASPNEEFEARHRLVALDH